MSESLPVVIGIDGGATYSFGVAVDLTGRALAAAKSGSLNFFGAGFQESRRSLSQMVFTLETALPLGNVIQYAVIGSAALFSEATGREKEQLCRGILPLDSVRLVSDVMTAYHAAGLGAPGLLVVGGTGSSFLARNEQGEFAQVGAWGHLLGDEGGAYWIGRECVRAAIATAEGSGPATSLLEAILRWFDVKVLTEIVPLVYQPKFSKDRFAALAGHVAQTVDPADAVWMDICDRAGRELARQATAAVRLANLRLRPVPVWLNGSVVRHNVRVRESLFAAMSAEFPIEHRPMRLAPLLGSAVLALRAAGVEVDPAMLERLERTYEGLERRDCTPAPGPAGPALRVP